MRIKVRHHYAKYIKNIPLNQGRVSPLTQKEENEQDTVCILYTVRTIFKCRLLITFSNLS